MGYFTFAGAINVLSRALAKDVIGLFPRSRVCDGSGWLGSTFGGLRTMRLDGFHFRRLAMDVVGLFPLSRYAMHVVGLSTHSRVCEECC